MEKRYLSNKERLLIFGPLILVIVLISFFIKIEQTSKEDHNKYIRSLEFHGIIMEKYRHFNHYEPMIKYRCENEIIEISTFNWSLLYENAEIGDSIFKNKGDTVAKLKKSNMNLIIKFNYFLDEGWGFKKR